MLLNKLEYKKKKPFRDASLYVIVCEGEKREVDYFNFFNGLTSKLKVHTYANEEGHSSPDHVLNNASLQHDRYDFGEGDELWIVVDTDHHIDNIHKVVKEVSNNPNWNMAISNPCFEVWLYYHIEEDLPDENVSQCSYWKEKVNDSIDGGFDSKRHPTLIETAVENSKKNYSTDGYIPQAGSTDIHILGERIFGLVENLLKEYMRKGYKNT